MAVGCKTGLVTGISGSTDLTGTRGSMFQRFHNFPQTVPMSGRQRIQIYYPVRDLPVIQQCVTYPTKGPEKVLNLSHIEVPTHLV